MFRAQLLREDLARLRRLAEIARSAAGREAFEAAARRLGWTQGDQRTAELAAQLDPLLAAVYDCEVGQGGDEAEERIGRAWVELTRARVGKLVGCLATPVPPPER